MNIVLILFLMLFGFYALNAEFIVRDIDFSNYNGEEDNDYINNFTGSDYSYSPTLTYGGSPGSVLPPTYTSWGENLARYRYSANPTIGETMVFSVDFLYDSSLGNPNSSFESPAGIFLGGNGNHGAKAYISNWHNGNIRITINTYYWNSTAAVNLLDNTWYRLIFTVEVVGGDFGDQSNLSATVLELPSMAIVATASRELNDIFFTTSDALTVSLHGARWGGASRLDNFHFEASTNDEIIDNGIDSDNDGIIDAYDAFPNNPSESTDTDGDGAGDNSDEFPAIPTQDVINTIKSNPTRYNLYSLDQIHDLRPGSTMIEVSENQATVQLQMEESSDLQTWEDTGTPATVTIPADTDTKFFRFKMAE